MLLNFYKYQGSGNDFIMIDNRLKKWQNFSEEDVKFLCDRKFGIGGDGLILLEDFPGYNFRMIYFNSDGRESTMCGNGGRCIVKFASDLGIIEEEYKFMAVDGEHRAIITHDMVNLKMIDVDRGEKIGEDIHLNTGSPHHIVWTNELNDLDILKDAREIRYNERYEDDGVNVNFVQRAGENELIIRTYERGVEDETLSCGTGVTAAALAHAQNYPDGSYNVKVKTAGGILNVEFVKTGSGYENIWLIGPAKYVFKGVVKL